MKKDVIIVSGPPGCGKSTIAQRISTYYKNPVIIERDMIRHELFGIFDSKEKVDNYYSSPGIRHREEKVTNTYYDRLFEIMVDDSVDCVILSDTFLNWKYVEEVINFVKKWDVHISVLMFDILEEENFRRNNMRPEVKRVDENIIKNFRKKVPNMIKMYKIAYISGTIDSMEFVR